MPQDPDRYVPDLSEVPPDPAEPVPVAFRAWEPTAANLHHSGPLWPEHFSKEHEDAQQWKREGRFVRVYEPVPEAPAPDPHLAGIDALIDYASSPDASLVPAPRPMILTREQGTALLRALYRSGVERVHCITAAGRPADGDPPMTGKQARTVIVDDPWPEHGPGAVREAVAALAKWPVHHGKSLLWAGMLDELERAKEPPELPPSPVVQAALVVDPTDPPEEP